MVKMPKNQKNSKPASAKAPRRVKSSRRETAKPIARPDHEGAGKSARVGREKRVESAAVRRPIRRRRTLPAKPPATISVSEARDGMAGLVDSIALHGGSTNVLYHGKVVATVAPPGAVPADQIAKEFTVDGVKRFPRALTGVGIMGPYALVRNGERAAVIYAPSISGGGSLAEDQVALTIKAMSDAWASLGEHITTAKDEIRAINRLRSNAIGATHAQIGVLERAGRKDLAIQFREALNAIEAKAARGGFEEDSSAT